MRGKIATLRLGILLGAAAMALLMSGPVVVVEADCPGEPGKSCGNGDVDGSGDIGFSDAIYILFYLFKQGPPPVAIAGALPATGVTESHETGDDGYYEAGCPMVDRFVDNGDGTVTDTCTGLMWVRADLFPGPAPDMWDTAIMLCEGLAFAGYDDWRLPNLRELQSLADYGRLGPAIDPALGLTDFEHLYWSSTTVEGLPDRAWCVSFNRGTVTSENKLAPLWYLLVRGGL